MPATATLANKSVAVTPGGEAVLEVRIRNSGTIVDQFTLEVLGDPAAWSIVEPAVIPLFPGAEGVARVHFKPPKSSSVPAKATPFAVRVKSREDARASLVEEGVVEVGPFNDTFAELIPRTAKGRMRARARLALDNRGNVSVNARLTAADPDRKLNFAIAPQALSAEAGTASFASIRLSPRQRFLTGPPKVSPYKVLVHQDGLPTITVDGAMQQEGLIPPWFLPAAIAAAAIILALVLLYFLVLRRDLQSTAQQQALTTAQQQVAAANQNAKSALDAAKKAQQAVSNGAGAAAGSNPVAGDNWSSRLAVDNTGSSGPSGPVESVFKVVPDGGLAVTDLVFENPSGNTGNVYLMRRTYADKTGKDLSKFTDEVLLSIRLENFRDLDFHFLVPPVFQNNQAMVLKCNPDPNNSLCNASVYYSGYLKKPTGS